MFSLNSLFQDELRWSGVIPLLIEATESILTKARNDIKLKTDYQDEINDYLRTLVGFIQNFVHNSKKNQVTKYILVIVLEILFSKGCFLDRDF